MIEITISNFRFISGESDTGSLLVIYSFDDLLFTMSWGKLFWNWNDFSQLCDQDVSWKNIDMHISNAQNKIKINLQLERIRNMKIIYFQTTTKTNLSQVSGALFSYPIYLQAVIHE